MLSKYPHKKFGKLLIGGTRNGVYKQKEFHGRGDKIVNMGELFAHRRLFDVPMKRVELNENEKKNSRLQRGDLLFARRSLTAEGAGKCSIVCAVYEPTTFESSIIRARPDPGSVDSLYLYYFFRSPHGAYKLDTIKRSVAVSGITGTDLVELDLPVPDLPIQKAIALILGALDDKIELNRRMNTTLEAMARALFKSWFVDFDPVRAKSEGRQPFDMDAETTALFPSCLTPSTLGDIPEGWVASNLVAEFNITMGQSPPGETYNEIGEGLPFYQGRTDFGSRYPSRRIFCTQPNRVAEAGDTLISVRAPVGDINMAFEKCILGRGVAAMRHKSGARGYTYYAAHSLQPDLKAFEADGTVFGSVNKQDLGKIKLTNPPEGLIKKFEALVSDVDEKILALTTESEKLENTRDYLLPKLISGDIRIPDAEKFMEAA